MRSAGLVERVSRRRAEAGGSGNAPVRDVAKPITPNVSAQAVQATISSPRAQDSPRAHSAAADQSHPDPGAPKSGPPANSAKVYSYNATTMRGSNAFLSGRARGLMFALTVWSSPKPSDTLSPIGVLVDACKYFRDDLIDNANIDAEASFDACESFDDDADV